jgi:hypothetical protein
VRERGGTEENEEQEQRDVTTGRINDSAMAVVENNSRL